jgi:hypothetical protein
MKIKYFISGIATFFISFIICVFIILAIDVHYHTKYLEKAGLNHRGYRGKAVGRKHRNEIRFVILGGSSAFGYGLKYYEALSAKLQEELQFFCDSLGYDKKITVINLAYNKEASYAFYYNLKDFLFLDYDYVIFYSGYNDMAPGNTTVYRHSNPVFRVFGYMPILPLIVSEKIMLLKSGVNLERAYRGESIVFKASAKDRIKVAALDKMLKYYDNLENVLDRLKKMKNVDFDSERLKEDRWSWYKHFMKKAIDFALRRDKKIIVITPPYLWEESEEGRFKAQQASLKGMLDKEYSRNDNVLYINLGESLSLKDERLSYDGLHLTAEGCQEMTAIITKKITPYVLESRERI